jgi:hypothetical protein
MSSALRRNKMASRKAHCKETLEKLGAEFDEVHSWIDGLACIDGQLNINHRRWRHHEEGVEEVREMFGDEAAKAAEIHIIRDCGRVLTRRSMESRYPAKPELMRFEDLN